MGTLLSVVEQSLQRAGIEYRVMDCDPALADTAAFCEHYNIDVNDSANAIIVASKTDPVQYVCCIVLATTRLDVNKKVCQLMEVKKASFASAEQTKELTGMEIGGVTPFGIPDGMPVYVDAAVMSRGEVVMGGGNRASKVLLSPGQLFKLPHMRVIEELAKPKPIDA